MGNKNKIISLAMIIIVITATTGVLLITSNKTSAKSHSDVNLPIMGNANEDDIIDEDDVSFIQDVIDGKRSSSNYSDANNDGVVNSADIAQVRAIIAHTETILYYTNVDDKICSVKYPIHSMVVTYNLYAEIVYILNATDLVIGIDDSLKTYKSLYSSICSLPSVGARATPDVEKILSINPDIYYTGTSASYDSALETKLKANGTNIDVVRLPSWEYGKVRQGVLTLGWILGHEEDAYQYIKWYDNIYSSIVEKVASVADSKKVTVLITSGTQAHSYGSGDFESSVIAGGKNIGSLLYTGNKYITYENEWVIEQNPDIIIGTVRAGYNGNHSGLLPIYTTLASSLNITDAVKNGGLHIMSYDILTGPGSIISLAYMAKWFYPELFADLDPEALHQEYIDQFLGGAVDVAALDSFAL